MKCIKSEQLAQEQLCLKWFTAEKKEQVILASLPVGRITSTRSSHGGKRCDVRSHGRLNKIRESGVLVLSHKAKFNGAAQVARASIPLSAADATHWLTSPSPAASPLLTLISKLLLILTQHPHHIQAWNATNVLCSLAMCHAATASTPHPMGRCLQCTPRIRLKKDRMPLRLEKAQASEIRRALLAKLLPGYFFPSTQCYPRNSRI